MNERLGERHAGVHRRVGLPCQVHDSRIWLQRPDRAPRPEKHDNRGTIVPGKRLVAGVAFFCFDSVFLVAQQPSPELALDEAARAFEQGKTTEAEQKLRPILEKHPSDLRALLLEGAVLDSAGRY